MSIKNQHNLWVSRKVKERFLVSDKNKIAFFYISKSACTTIRNIIHIDNGRNTGNNIEKSKEEIKDFQKVAIVRNPYLRFISGYVSNADDLPNIRHLDFEHFLIEMCKINKTNINVHFAPQMELIQNVDNIIILKMENIDNINDFLNDNNFKINFSNIKKNYGNINKRDNLINILKNNQKLRNMIYNFYELDFITFDYDKNF